MPKIPDREWDGGSLASGPSTLFGAANMLWTPTMDRPIPTLAEQRIMAIAKAVREQR